jgi:hypothetical protein
MSAANDPAAWQNFYVMMGTANASITGLVFVACPDGPPAGGAAT